VPSSSGVFSVGRREHARQIARRRVAQEIVDDDVRIGLRGAERGRQFARPQREGIKIENVRHTIRSGRGDE